jgi:hypothetical protein
MGIKDRPELIESVDRIEPAQLERTSPEIADVLAELAAQGATPGKVRHPMTATARDGRSALFLTELQVSARAGRRVRRNCEAALSPARSLRA